MWREEKRSGRKEDINRERQAAYVGVSIPAVCLRNEEKEEEKRKVAVDYIQKQQDKM